MRHFGNLLIVAFLVLGVAGCSMHSSNGDLAKEGVSSVSYGRVKCAKCGFEFKAPVKKPTEDLTREGASGISYGRVKCSKCGFEFEPRHSEDSGSEQ